MNESNFECLRTRRRVSIQFLNCWHVESKSASLCELTDTVVELPIVYHERRLRKLEYLVWKNLVLVFKGRKTYYQKSSMP